MNIYLYTSVFHIHHNHLIQTLITLSLESNEVSFEGIKYLADALKNNQVRLILSTFSSLLIIHLRL